MFVCYILRSRSSGKYYTGSTQNLENRLREHNRGECQSTRAGVPWDVVWAEQFEDRSSAVAKERQVKVRGARRFLEALHRGHSD